MGGRAGYLTLVLPFSTVEKAIVDPLELMKWQDELHDVYWKALCGYDEYAESELLEITERYVYGKTSYSKQRQAASAAVSRRNKQRRID
jgi:hypothetical protein